MTSLLQSISASERSFQEKLDHMLRFATHNMISADVRGRIKTYFNYVWSRQRGVNESVIMANLPEALRLEVCPVFHNIQYALVLVYGILHVATFVYGCLIFHFHHVFARNSGFSSHVFGTANDFTTICRL